MKEGTSDWAFAWNQTPPALEILKSRICARQNDTIFQLLAYITQACEDGSLTILVVSCHPGPGQQQIAEPLQLRRIERPYGHDPL